MIVTIINCVNDLQLTTLFHRSVLNFTYWLRTFLGWWPVKIVNEQWPKTVMSTNTTPMQQYLWIKVLLWRDLVKICVNQSFAVKTHYSIWAIPLSIFPQSSIFSLYIFRNSQLIWMAVNQLKYQKFLLLKHQHWPQLRPKDNEYFLSLLERLWKWAAELNNSALHMP